MYKKSNQFEKMRMYWLLAVAPFSSKKIGYNVGRLWQLPQLPTTVCYKIVADRRGCLN